MSASAMRRRSGLPTLRGRASAFVCLAALAALPACSKAYKDSIELTNQGVRAFQGENYARARSYFVSALNVYEDNQPAHYHMGLIALYQDKDLDAAQTHLHRAATLEPRDRDALFHLARVRTAKEDYEGALQHLKTVLMLDPDFAPGWYQRGVVLEKMGDLDGADAAFRESVTIDPLYARGFVALGSLYESVEAWDVAAEVYEEGLRHSPEDIDLANNLGILKMRAGADEEALQLFRRAAKRADMRFDIYFNFAFALAQADKKKTAIKFLDTYVANATTADAGTVDVARSLRTALLKDIQREEMAKEDKGASRR